MTEITVEAKCGTTKVFESRQKAEEGIDTHAALCQECDESDIDMVVSDGNTDSKLSEEAMRKAQAEVVKQQDTDEKTTEPVMSDDETTEVEAERLPDEQPGVDTDPLDWVPSDFVDHIDGQPAINRKGYDVLAHHYNISVETEVLVSPSETGFEYAEVVATAETDEGVTYTAHGSAHTDRGDDSYLLLEMADTRAAKRATARATGVGMVAVQELQNEL